jgi:hypothetical protein
MIHILSDIRPTVCHDVHTERPPPPTTRLRLALVALVKSGGVRDLRRDFAGLAEI